MDTTIVGGWLSGARPLPSSNYNERPEGEIVDLLVIHNISLPPGQFGGGYIEQFFCNHLDPDLDPYFATIADLRVSSHLLIDRGGRVTQFVPFTARAWHAGCSCFRGRDNCNDFSIGIELEGTDTDAFTDPQYSALVAVTVSLMREYPALTADRITGHCDIAPGRKTDPGAAFDWPRYLTSL